MTIVELEKQRDAKRGEAQALHDLAAKAGRDFTDDEEKTFDALMCEADKAQASVKATTERTKRLAALETNTTASLGRTSEPNPVGPSHVVEVGKNRIEDDPNKGFKTPRAFLAAVMDAGRHGTLTKGLKCLRAPAERMGEPLAAAGSDEHGTYADPYGGFFVPEGFAPNLWKLEPEKDPTGSNTQNVPMATPVVKINARVDKTHTSSVSGGLTVGRSAETVAKTASRMTTEQLSVTAHSLFGLSYATEELLTDSPMSFIAILEAGFRDEFNSHIINERINGTGVSQFVGVMTSGALITVAKETSPVAQTTDTIVYKNVIKMRARCWGYDKAMWIANHDTIPTLMQMNVEVGVGGAPVWQPSAREDHPDILLGRPIIYTEYMQTVGDLGDIGLFNWSQYLEGTLQPLRSAESVHVRFLNHERAFKFWLRNAGMPWWSAALTPKNGSTLSPFVTLAAR